MADGIEALRHSYLRKKGKSASSFDSSGLIADCFAWIINIMIITGICIGFAALREAIPSYKPTTPAEQSTNSPGIFSSKLRDILKKPIDEAKSMARSRASTPQAEAFTGKVEKHLDKEWRQVRGVGPKVLPNRVIEQAKKKAAWQQESDGLETLE